MHSHHAIIHLPPIAVPLPPDAHRIVSALGNGGLIHHADRLPVAMISGRHLLATIMEFLFIPLDGFEETLYCSWSFAKLKGDALGRFSMQIRQLSLNIDSQQLPRRASPKAIGKQPEKRRQLPTQRSNLFQRHLDDPP
jgi:hypothetical protein